MSIPVVPAIIPESAEHAKQVLGQLAFSREVHLDVVDGVFVPFSSWPIAPSGDPQEIKYLTDRYTYEVDLMVAKPLPLAERFLAAGADMIVFHIETITLEALTRFAESTNISIGVSAHSSTPETVLRPYLAVADYVQVMGIAKIGSQGQPFDASALKRISWMKSVAPELFVTVDGSVNQDSIPSLVKAGADRLICGSAIVKASHPAEAFETLQALANNSQPYL